MRKILLAFVLCAALFPVTVLADTLPSGTVSAFVRVECSAPGQEGTLLSRTEVRFDDAETHSALEALILATGGEVTVETSDFGAYVLSVCGVSDETGSMSWMYAVNNELPQVGIDAYELNYRDELVVYFVDWSEASYAYFTPSVTQAVVGKPFTLTLTGNHYEDGLFPVEGASLFIEPDREDIPMPRNLIYTDEKGKVELTLYHAAKYTISAIKAEPDGISVISRPLCEVTVLEEDPTQIKIEVEPKDTPELTVGPIAITPAAPEWPVPVISLLPAVSYDPETGELRLFGELFEIGEAYRPIYENNVVYLPVRAVVDALGGEVTWDEESGTASVRLNGASFQFKLSDVLDGTPVKVVSDRAYLPAEYLLKQLDLQSVVGFAE